MVATPRDANEQMLLTAADWWTRLRDPQAGEATIAQWLDWTEADVRHLDAFEHVSAFAERLGRLDARARRQLLAEFAPATAPRRRWLPLAAAAAVLAVVLGSGLLLWGRFAGEASAAPEVYASTVGQNRNVALADGSEVALGGASRISVHYTHGMRQVTLEAGEAYFQVVHNAQRPFEVVAGPLVVRDIGTAFDVRRTGDRVAVAVVRGKVRVAAPGGALDAGAEQRVSWDPATQDLRLGVVTPEQAIGWRSQRLEFVDEPLAVVIANVNRYSAKPVRLEGAGLDGLSFTGTVRTDEIGNWLHALPQVFPLRVETGAHAVTLSANQPVALRR